ncbi:ATP/GTP-binding protein [Streptomyces sp. NPDC006668]|uniref:ATP/GTP-binding protein n=1 Tax=Streptomyces sp. NPDC006668 TaxID=3156903 RepID=UPI0033FBD4E0
MLRRTAAAIPAILLTLGLTAPATASDGQGADPDCGSSVVVITVCAQDDGRAPGGRGGSGREATTSGSGSPGSASAAKCTYTKLDPQPSADNLAMQDGKRQGGKGAAYQVYCPATARIGLVWVPDGAQTPAQPAVDPETVARQAVASMKLVGPDIASPRHTGHYVVGMPMWTWVHQGPTTYGPNTAGGVTVTATARVSSVSWTMGDGGTPVVCPGPSTRYQSSMGLADSPDCGYRYTRPSASQPGHRYTATSTSTSTSTWTITWQVQNGGRRRRRADQDPHHHPDHRHRRSPGRHLLTP